MKFRRVAIENYKSFHFPIEIEFPNDRNGSPIFIIGGMSGSGKTAIIEGINYCLYGGKVEEIFQSINKRALFLGNAFVSFELQIEMDDASKLTIKRSWNAGLLLAPKAKELVERLDVFKDGKRIVTKNKQVLEDYIRSIFPPKFTESFFFNDKILKDIISNDQLGMKIKSSLESAHEIEYINKLSSYLLYIKQEETKDFQDTINDEVSSKENEIKFNKIRISTINEEAGKVKNDLELLKLQYEEETKKFDEEAKKENAKCLPAELNNEQTIDNKIDRIEDTTYRVQFSNRSGELDSEAFISCERYLPYSLLEGLFKDIRHQISNPTDRIYEKIVQKLEAIERTNNFILVPRFNNSYKPDAELEHAKAKLEKEKAEKVERIRLHQIKLDELKLKKDIISNQINLKTEQLKKLKEEVLYLGKKIIDDEIKLKELYDRNNIPNSKTYIIKECDKIVGLLYQLIVNMRKNKVKLLQEKINEMYKLILGEKGLVKNIIMDEKDYEVRILDYNGQEIKKTALPPGEKEVFGLSLLWGLSKVSGLKCPIILDIPLSKFNTTNRDNIIKNYLPNAAQQVIVLSTDTGDDIACYKALRSDLSGAVNLIFNKKQQLTTTKNGYFWER